MEEKIIVNGKFKNLSINTIFLTSSILGIVGVFGGIYIGAFVFYSPVPFFLGCALPVINIVFGFMCRKVVGKMELVVTNKRIYGQVIFGRKIDLPYDSISSVGTCFPKGVFASTSSGSIKFILLTNQSNVYNQISNLLKERQTSFNERTVATPSPVPTTTPSNADEIVKYKNLLDMGAITQEEYDAKKNQLLGISINSAPVAQVMPQNENAAPVAAIFRVYCSGCGTLNENARFCCKCGKPLQ